MDENKRDDSRNRIREEALARRLGEAFDRLERRNAGECPDATLLAAYYERALEPVEATKCETHFAACARCRKVLSILAASVDVPLAEAEVATLGKLVTETQHTHSRAPRQSPKAWRWQWFAPAFGAAAVLALWFAVRPLRNPPGNDAPTIVAENSEPSRQTYTGNTVRNGGGIPAADAPNTAESKTAGQRSARTTVSGAASAEQAQKSADTTGRFSDERTDKKERENLDTLQASRGESPIPAQASRSGSVSGRSVSGVVEPRASALSVAPASPAPPPQSTAQEAPAAEALSAGNASSAGNAPIAEGQQKRLATSQIRTMSKVADASATGSTPTLLLKSPSGASSWRVGNSGSIERSTDGRTWTLQQSPLHEDWLSGAVISDSICWLAGRNGAIARTIDGQKWERIAPPTQSANASGKLPDWISITARDAQFATITATGGRRYLTQDGGKTWRVE